MDPSVLCTDDHSPAPTEGQTGDSLTDSVLLSASEPQTETESGILGTTHDSTINASTAADSLKCLLHSCDDSQHFPVCLAPLLKIDVKEHRCLDSSEYESEVSSLLPRDVFSVKSTSAEFGAKKETPLSLSLMKEVGSHEPSKQLQPTSLEHSSIFRSLSAPTDSLDSDAMVGPMSDLYIFEGDTHDVNLSQTVDPSELTCPEYLPLSQTGKEKVGHDCGPHVLMCDSEGIVSPCHHSFSKEQAIESNLSEVSQHEELQPPAVDAWGVELMLGSDVRSGKAEVTDLTLDLQRSDSPVEHWMDARQDLRGEDEYVENLDKASHFILQEHQVSGYSPGDSKRIDCSIDDTKGWGPPVRRWSSVDSWATALSDWTGIVEDPSEDIAAAFAEIGAEIDALTQSLDKLSGNTESDTLHKSLKTTERERAKEVMGIQDQLLKNQGIPENSIHPDQSCLSLGFQAEGSEHQDNSDLKIFESLCDPENTTKKEQLARLSLEGSPRVTVASSEGYTMAEITLRTVTSSSSDLDFYKTDGYFRIFEDDIFLNDEVLPIKLTITEDTGSITCPELVLEEVR